MTGRHPPVHRSRAAVRVVALLLALLLGACTNTSATVGPSVTSPSAVPTAAPSQRPTSVPTPPPSSATSAPEPTDAPTAIPTSLPEPTAAPTAPPATAVPTAAPTSAPTAAPTSAPQPAAEQLLFLRGGDLYALDLASRRTLLLIEDVSDFVASPDSSQLALLRGTGPRTELWIARRDGSALTQITHNTRAEATPSWAPDGTALAYGSSPSAEPYGYDWLAWSAWCAASEVRVVDIAAQSETALAPGCDPSISPDGRRIAFAAPPSRVALGFGDTGPREGNAIRLINRQGKNGWNFARADGGSSPSGLLVYAPSWMPDGAHVLYQRFVGMQVEVSVNLTELGRSFEGKGRALDEGAGWLLAARPSPNGALVSITENNYDNARGLTGYGSWGVSLIRLEGQRDVAMPSGMVTMIGQQVGKLPAGQRTAWSPDGRALAVQLPEDWRAGADPEPWVEAQGTIWRWVPGADPAEQLVDDVDYASPLAWLPGA